MISGHINEVYIKPCALNPAQVMSVAQVICRSSHMPLSSRSQVMSVALKSLLSHVCRSQVALKSLSNRSQA